MKESLRIMVMPLIVLCLLAADMEAQTYTITQLATFGGQNGTEATALSDTGKAVGWSSKGSSVQLPFLSFGKVIRSTGSLGGTYGVALGVNSSTEVVGGSNTSQRETHAFLWKPGTGMQDLGTLGGSQSQAQAVNILGHIAGWSERTDGSTHAIYLADGVTMQDLGTLGGTFSQAFALNDSGQVVGWSFPASGSARAFLWTQAGGMQDLGTLGGSGATALAINSSGHVVGNSLMAGDLTSHAFLWSKSRGIQDLGVLPGGDSSVAYGINASGTVVGAAATVPGGIGYHAFVWTKSGGMKDLNTLIPPGTGWLLAQAAAINSSGQITGWGTVNNGPAQGFILTPVGSAETPIRR